MDDSDDSRTPHDRAHKTKGPSSESQSEGRETSTKIFTEALLTPCIQRLLNLLGTVMVRVKAGDGLWEHTTSISFPG